MVIQIHLFQIHPFLYFHFILLLLHKKPYSKPALLRFPFEARAEGGGCRGQREALWSEGQRAVPVSTHHQGVVLPLYVHIPSFYPDNKLGLKLEEACPTSLERLFGV